MHWSTALYQAADRFDGGDRSFPLSSEAAIARKHGYEPPNEDYERLFFRQASIPRSQRHSDAAPRSAGWLVPHPDDDSVCKPVFIAHSVLSAIWLLRETLADDALSNDGWDGLVRAAQSLAEDGMVEPPSAQKPSAQRVSTPPAPRSAKRLAPSGQDRPSPKRARTEAGADDPPPSGLAADGDETDGDQEDGDRPAGGQPLITTVTNRNRAAERQRRKAYEAAQVERDLDLGLVAPDTKANNDERGAYAGVPAEDKSLISWLFKQDAVDKRRQKTPFYHAVDAPYLRARDFLAKARALGSPSSREHAASFLQIWRRQGDLFGDGASPVQFSQTQRTRSSSSQPSGVDGAFRYAWARCKTFEEVVQSVQIKYRWAQALLGRAMTHKLAELERSDRLLSSDKKSRFGKGPRRKEAIDSLLLLVNPDSPSKKERDAFRDRINRALKWYKIADGLGWGVLLVMPEDVIPKTWVERGIHSWGVDVFIDLVRRERPDVCLAAKQFDEWLGQDGIAGGDIKGKERLTIELSALGTTSRIEEVSDSDSDSDSDNGIEEDDGDGDRRPEIMQSQVRSNSAPAAPLRQTTLPELFKAVG